MLLSVRLRPGGGSGTTDADAIAPVATLETAPSPVGLPSPWLERAEQALALLQARPGFLRGWIGRSPDDPGECLLAAEFASAGDLRRAVSAADVRPVLWPLLADAQIGATTYEVLVRGAAGAGLERLGSDLAPDAAEVRLGQVPQPPLET